MDFFSNQQRVGNGTYAYGSVYDIWIFINTLALLTLWLSPIQEAVIMTAEEIYF